jgi:hypothetical protein
MDWSKAQEISEMLTGLRAETELETSRVGSSSVNLSTKKVGENVACVQLATAPN